MGEIKELIFTLDYDYGNLKRRKNSYSNELNEYTIDDLLDEIETLYGENEDYENEIDELKEEIKELNDRIRDYEEKENKNE